MSERKAKANKENAQLSTGPRSAAGKASSSQNALQHGLLSRKLLLPHESADEFNALMGQLQNELNPVGTLELAMVERIAIAYWRQRRLVAAESATLEIQQKDLNFNALLKVRALAEVGQQDDEWIKSLALETPNMKEVQTALQEMEALRDGVNLAEFRRACPQAWEDLVAECDPPLGESPQAQEAAIALYFQQMGVGGLDEWVQSTCVHYRKMVRIVSALQTVQQAASLPQNADVFARYQSSLDNDIYKATRALREAQKYRFELAALNAKALPTE